MNNFWTLNVFVTDDSPSLVVDLTITVGGPHRLLLDNEADITKTTVMFEHTFDESDTILRRENVYPHKAGAIKHALRYIKQIEIDYLTNGKDSSQVTEDGYLSALRLKNRIMLENPEYAF